MINGKIIAVANQKGGVGKTTTTLSLGVALAKQGKRVLLIDADPQANLTTCLGVDDLAIERDTLSSLMTKKDEEKIYLEDLIVKTNEGVDLIPSDINLCMADLKLISKIDKERVLKSYIEESNIKEDYDYILIDCMPSINIMTLNCLTCSDEVLIPIQSHYLAIRGMDLLLDTIDNVKRSLNRNLEVSGFLLTLVNKNTNISKVIRELLEENFGNIYKVFDTEIPYTVRVPESNSMGKSIYNYNKGTKIASIYEEFANEFLEREQEIKRKKEEMER